MKYIIFECKSDGHPTLHLPVIFSDEFIHKDIAEAVEHVKVTPDGPFAGWWQWPKPISAGFINTSSGACYGYSESLDLKARVEDAEICAKGKERSSAKP